MERGDNPYGPSRFKCELLQPVVGRTTHHSIVRYEGRWWLFHHDCVPSGDITHLRSLKVMPLDDKLFGQSGIPQTVAQQEEAANIIINRIGFY